MSFRTRLIVAFVSISVLTLGATFSAIYLAVERSELAQLDVALLSEAREEASEIRDEGQARLVIGEGPGPTVDDIGPLTKYAALYEPSGEVLDATEAFGDEPPELDSLSISTFQPFDLELEGDESLRGVLVPVPDSANVLLLAAPRTHLEQDSRYLWRTLSVLLVVGGLISFALASWVIRRLTDEHHRIATVVRRVADGDLTQRVASSGASGETAQLAADIDEMIDRLALLLDSQKRFIAHASHEMRSPLSILCGELSHALRKPRTEEEYRAALGEAHDSARHLAALTDDLLALARLGSGAVTPSEPVPVRVAVERAIAFAKRSHGERDVEVVARGDDAVASGRASDVERMIANLVINAIRHSPDGGVVDVSIVRGATEVSIHVRDTGEGVRPEEREKIFEPFYRGTRERAAIESGTGLGLAIAREIARAQGGDILLEEAPPGGGGACFTVRLPRIDDA